MTNTNTKDNFKLYGDIIVYDDPTGLINDGWGGTGRERN